MKKFKVNLENASKIKDTVLTDESNGVEYFFEMVTVKGGSKVFLIEMNVDAYDEDGEWLDEHSGSFQANQVLFEADAAWVSLI